MSVFKSWAKSCYLENVSTETMSPGELEAVLTKFYTKVKQTNKQTNKQTKTEMIRVPLNVFKGQYYLLCIVRSREFHRSQEILNTRAISLRQQEKGKRPNEAKPLTPEEETALWEKGQLGDFSGKVLTNVNFKNVTEQLGLRCRQEHYDSFVVDLLMMALK